MLEIIWCCGRGQQKPQVVLPRQSTKKKSICSFFYLYLSFWSCVFVVVFPKQSTKKNSICSFRMYLFCLKFVFVSPALLAPDRLDYILMKKEEVEVVCGGILAYWANCLVSSWAPAARILDSCIQSRYYVYSSNISGSFYFFAPNNGVSSCLVPGWCGDIRSVHIRHKYPITPIHVLNICREPISP